MTGWLIGAGVAVAAFFIWLAWRAQKARGRLEAIEAAWRKSYEDLERAREAVDRLRDPDERRRLLDDYTDE